MSTGYEKRDVSVKALVGGTVAIVVIIAAFLIFLRDYFVYNVESAVLKEAMIPSKELQEIRENALQKMNSYAVLDKEKGIYQIPIERAMELVINEYNR